MGQAVMEETFEVSEGQVCSWCLGLIVEVGEIFFERNVVWVV